MKSTRLGQARKDAERMTLEIDRAAEYTAMERARQMAKEQAASSVTQRSIGSAALGQLMRQNERRNEALGTEGIEGGGLNDERALSAYEQAAEQDSGGGGRLSNTSTGEMMRGAATEQEVLAGDARIKELVAIENGYASSDGLEVGASVAGAESKKEIKERLRDDREDLEMEAGAGWGHELLTKGQERLTNEAVKRIDEVVEQRSMRPGELERARFLGMNAILATYGRKFGERN